jgi:hypothetical protein
MPEPPAYFPIAKNLNDLIQLLGRAGTGIDVRELCGGETRTTTITIRRRLTTGENFDLVARVDLRGPQDAATSRPLFSQNHALVLAMALFCRIAAVSPLNNGSHMCRSYR